MKYRGHRYWEEEAGRKAATEKLRVVFYRQAGKLQVSHAWRDAKSGKVRYGRTAVLDAAVLGSSPEAIALLEQFLDAARHPNSIPGTTPEPPGTIPERKPVSAHEA
jgi:hypothetical protein